MNLNKNDWYYWGRWKASVLMNSPWMTCGETVICNELPLFKELAYNLLLLDGHYFAWLDDVKKAQNILHSCVDGQSNELDVLLKRCHREGQALLALEKGGSVSDFIGQWKECFAASFLIQLCDLSLPTIIHDLCSSYQLNAEEVIAAIHPNQPTLYSEYKRKLPTTSPENLAALVHEYAWIGTRFLENEPLTLVKALEERIQPSSLQADFQPASTDHFPVLIQKVISLASEMLYQRTYLYEVASKVSFSYRALIQGLCDTRTIPLTTLTSLTIDELDEWITTATLPSHWQERQNGYGLLYQENTLTLFTGQNLEQLLEITVSQQDSNITEVSGRPAYLGKVTGRAVLVYETKDLAKIKVGDILITPETIPDYIVGMSKAAGFVTEVGGITSHAAIIAREMHKPCIVGTKIATHVFKDGDMIELDAKSGIARKL